MGECGEYFYCLTLPQNTNFLNQSYPATQEVVIPPKKNTKLKEIKDCKNQGKLIIDATCAPADIREPTDLNILNQGRIKTEKIIDIFYRSPKRIFARSEDFW